MKIHTFQRENIWKSLQICTWKNKINKQKYQHDCCYIIQQSLCYSLTGSIKVRLEAEISHFLFFCLSTGPAIWQYIPPLWPLSIIYSKPSIQGHWFNFHYKFGIFSYSEQTKLCIITVYYKLLSLLSSWYFSTFSFSFSPILLHLGTVTSKIIIFITIINIIILLLSALKLDW